MLTIHHPDNSRSQRILWLHYEEVRTNLRKSYPKLAGYLDRIRARPAYQAAIEKGGPYGLMQVDKK